MAHRAPRDLEPDTAGRRSRPLGGEAALRDDLVDVVEIADSLAGAAGHGALGSSASMIRFGLPSRMLTPCAYEKPAEWRRDPGRTCRLRVGGKFVSGPVAGMLLRLATVGEGPSHGTTPPGHEEFPRPSTCSVPAKTHPAAGRCCLRQRRRGAAPQPMHDTCALRCGLVSFTVAGIPPDKVRRRHAARRSTSECPRPPRPTSTWRRVGCGSWDVPRSTTATSATRSRGSATPCPPSPAPLTVGGTARELAWQPAHRSLPGGGRSWRGWSGSAPQCIRLRVDDAAGAAPRSIGRCVVDAAGWSDGRWHDRYPDRVGRAELSGWRCRHGEREREGDHRDSRSGKRRAPRRARLARSELQSGPGAGTYDSIAGERLSAEGRPEVDGVG